MKIYTAQVTSTMDPARAGYVQIFCEDEPKATEAIYTTPFYKYHSNGGFFAPPAENSNILIAFDQKTEKAYYLSTIIEGASQFMQDFTNYDENSKSKARTTELIKDSQKFYEGWAPASITLKNEEENGLSITDRNSKKYMVNETRLNNGGKVLSLNSSPEIDSVLLDNGHGDYLKITGMPESAVGLPPEPKRSLQAKTLLSQEYTTDRGSIDLRVVEGKDITIENDSTGFMSLGGVGGVKSGNVNIFSKWKNIRLAAKGTIFPPNVGGQIILETALSKIFNTNLGIALKAGLSTLGASIEMQAATGTIIIKNTISKIVMTNLGMTLSCGAASIELTPLGTITLIAPLGVNLVTPGINTTSQSLGFAQGIVNIGSPASIVNIQGTTVNVNGTAAVNIDGTAGIYLNTGQATTAIGAGSILNIPFVPPTPANPATLGSTPIVPTTDVEYPSGSKFPV